MSDLYFERCIELAKKSTCQKRGFGCLLLVRGTIVAEICNTPLECAKHLCEPTCIRFDMGSGADSMIGACGHAEELAIWRALNEKIDIRGAVLYVAGVNKPNNDILEKSEPYFYCIRCATLMQYAGIVGVYVFVGGIWVFQTTEQAYASSLRFALGQERLSGNKA